MREGRGAYLEGLILSHSRSSIPAAIIAAGLGVNLRSRLLGGSLKLLGAVPLAVMSWWTIIAPILAGLTLAIWIIAFRADRVTRS